jgi:hypothetical protein
MTAAITHPVESNVHEAVEELNIDGELTSDESGVTFSSESLTISARYYGSTTVTVRLSVGNSSTVEVEDTMTIETTNPRSICFAVADTKDRLEALSECVELLEDYGWSITRAVKSTVFMSNKDKEMFMTMRTWIVSILGRNRRSAANVLHKAGIIESTKCPRWQSGEYRLA